MQKEVSRLNHGFDLSSDVLLPFGRLWYGEPNAATNAIGCAEFYSWSHNAVIRVYDDAGNVIATHEHAGEFKGGEFLLESPRSSARANAHGSA
jgi:hypothetical protein